MSDMARCSVLLPVALIAIAINCLVYATVHSAERVAPLASPTRRPTPTPSIPVVHRRVLGGSMLPTQAPVVALSSVSLPVAAPQPRPFYLVASPESNGNRFVVSLLMSAGCYGVSGHMQPFDDRAQRVWPNHFRPTHFRSPCGVMHRSVPHAAVWPDLPSLVRQIRSAGFEPRILVSLRPEDVAAASQVAQKHVATRAEAEDNIRHAQRHIVTALAAMPDVWFRFVHYEQLGHEHYLHHLFGREMALQLPANHPKFVDKDSKHYH